MNEPQHCQLSWLGRPTRLLSDFGGQVSLKGQVRFSSELRFEIGRPHLMGGGRAPK